MTAMTKFNMVGLGVPTNMVGLGVPTKVRVAGKDFPTSCASKVPLIMGVLAMLNQTCNSVKMP